MEEEKFMADIAEIIRALTEKNSSRSLSELAEPLKKFCRENEEEYCSQASSILGELKDVLAGPYAERHFPKDANNLWLIKDAATGKLYDFIERYVDENEGWMFKADKADFTLKKVVEALEKGENLSLFRDYTAVGETDEARKHLRAYWSPSSWEDTDGVIRSYTDWVLVKKGRQDDRH